MLDIRAEEQAPRNHREKPGPGLLGEIIHTVKYMKLVPGGLSQPRGVHLPYGLGDGMILL